MDLNAFLRCSDKRYPRLSTDEEITLGRAVRQWQDWEGGPAAAPRHVARSGQRAHERLVGSNLRFGFFIARGFSGHGVPMDDLLSAATEGLIQASLRYEPKTGYKFISYAVWWVKQQLQIQVASQSMSMKLSTTVFQKFYKATRAEARLLRETGVAPTAEAIEDAAGLKRGQLDQLKAMIRLARRCSIDSTARSESGNRSSTMHESISDGVCIQTRLEAEDEHERIRELFAKATKLSPQQRWLIVQRFLVDKPLNEHQCAAQLQLKRKTVARLIADALKHLRELASEQWNSTKN